MTALVNVLKSRLEILALNVRLGLEPGSEAFQKLSKSAAGAVKAVCEGVRLVSTTELEVLLRLIAESALGESERDELRDLFNQKLDSSLGASNGVSKMNLTTVECPENYFTEAEWREILLNEKTSVHAKLTFLCTRWSRLGLAHPTEICAKNIASLGMLTERDEVARGPSGVLHVRAFKKMLRDFAAKEPLAPEVKVPAEFPSNVAMVKDSFAQWYKHAFGDSDPVQCPADIMVLVKRMQGRVACRSSKLGCSALSTSKPPMRSNFAMQQACNLAMAMGGQQDPSLPGLVIFGADRGVASQGSPGSTMVLPRQGSPGSRMVLPGTAGAQTLATFPVAKPPSKEMLALPAPDQAAPDSKDQNLPGQPLHPAPKQGAPNLASHVAQMQAILQGSKKGVKRKLAGAGLGDEDSDGEGSSTEGEVGAKAQGATQAKKKNVRGKACSAQHVKGKVCSNKGKGSNAKSKTQTKQGGGSVKQAGRRLCAQGAKQGVCSVKGSLKYPGTKTRKPMIVGKSKIYFNSPFMFRVKRHFLDKKDKAFSYKGCPPQHAWRNVVDFLKSCNPGL